jgi:segregation and condensation protein B
MAALEDLKREPLGEQDLKLAVEAVLFASSLSLSPHEIAKSVGSTPAKVKRALGSLRTEYQRRKTSIEVAKIGPKYTMQIRSKYLAVAAGYASTKIPKHLLKTLALVAYHQPIKQSEVFPMVGQKLYDQVRVLEEMKVLRHIPWGNSKILFTTHRFSEIFGIEGNSRDDIKRWMAKQVGIPEEQVERDIAKSHTKEEEMGDVVTQNAAADEQAVAEARAQAAAGGDPAVRGDGEPGEE